MHKVLIDNIINDFKDFFMSKELSRIIKYRWVNDMSDGMKVMRKGKKSYLAISTDIKYLEIDTDIIKLYILFMVGHELAHLVNKHLNYKDKNTFDSQTIELWADFFGAKVSMSILQDGTRFNKMLDANFADANIGLEKIFYALIELNNNVYSNTNGSKKYLNSSERASSVIAGIISFLTRKGMVRNLNLSEHNHAEVGFDWGIAVNAKLLDLGLLKKLFPYGTKSDADIEKLMSNVFIIHKSLKQKHMQLLKGLNPVQTYILDTSYIEHKPNTLLIEKFNHYFKELEWDNRI